MAPINAVEISAKLRTENKKNSFSSVIVSRDINESIKNVQSICSGTLTTVDRGIYQLETKTDMIVFLSAEMFGLEEGTYCVIESQAYNADSAVKRLSLYGRLYTALCNGNIALKIYAQGKDINADWETIPKALEYIKRDNKYQFLRSFHTFLQKSKSHYTPDSEGAERLALKYYQYYLQIREFMRQEYQMDILHNIVKFPVDTDNAVQEYREKITALINRHYEYRTFSHEPRMYVHKTVPFIVSNRLYYEITLL